MGYSTANTVWPTVSIPDDIKLLTDGFFSAVDDTTDKTGDTLADEVFTPDGVKVAAAGTATGSAEIRKSRENAWDVVKKRRHSIKRVYVHNTESSDLMLLGSVEMTVENGQSVDMEFTAKMMVELGPPARLKSYQVWAHPTPLTKLLSSAKAMSNSEQVDGDVSPAMTSK